MGDKVTPLLDRYKAICEKRDAEIAAKKAAKEAEIAAKKVAKEAEIAAKKAAAKAAAKKVKRKRRDSKHRKRSRSVTMGACNMFKGFLKLLPIPGIGRRGTAGLDARG